MVKEVLTVLPDAVTRCPAGVAVCCAVSGLALWVVGARFSRSLLTLAGVSAGTVLGMRLPGWCGWDVEGMGVGVAGAIVLGTFAFLFHRTYIGLLLGAGIMLWAGLGVWVARAGDAQWNWRTVKWQGDTVQLLRDTWATLPPHLHRSLPIACATGLATGLMLAVFSGKLSKVLAHSLAGMTLMVLMGAVALLHTRPQWLASLPGSNLSQGAILIALVVVGAGWQWHITPPRPARSQTVRDNA
jgi:hypothetical protein